MLSKTTTRSEESWSKTRLSERRQPEWVSTVLDPEDTEQKAVHAKDDTTPDKDGDLLCAWVGHAWNLQSKRDRRECEDAVCGCVSEFCCLCDMQGRRLTHSGDNLRLKTKLVLETTSKVSHTASAVSRHVWHLANVVVHMSAGEKKNGDQADCSPEIAVLDNREDIWGRDSEETDRTGNSNNGRNDLDVVDWANDRWVRRVR